LRQRCGFPITPLLLSLLNQSSNLLLAKGFCAFTLRNLRIFTTISFRRRRNLDTVFRFFSPEDASSRPLHDKLLFPSRAVFSFPFLSTHTSWTRCLCWHDSPRDIIVHAKSFLPSDMDYTLPLRTPLSLIFILLIFSYLRSPTHLYRKLFRSPMRLTAEECPYDVVLIPHPPPLAPRRAVI